MQDQMSLKSYLALIALIGAIFLAPMLFMNLLEGVFGRIIPGSGMRANFGPGPVETAFKIVGTRAVDTTKAVAEWRLTVPGQSILRSIGKDSYVGGNSSGRFHATTFIIKRDHSGFVDHEIQIEKSRAVGGDYPYLHIENTVSTHSCVSDDELNPRICTNRAARCRIYTNYYGWDVNYAVPIKEYRERPHKEICENIISLLDQVTTSVDAVKSPYSSN